MKTKKELLAELAGADTEGQRAQFVNGYSGTLERFIDSIQRDAWQSATKAQMERCAMFLEGIHSEDGCADAGFAPFPGDPT